MGPWKTGAPGCVPAFWEVKPRCPGSLSANRLTATTVLIALAAVFLCTEAQAYWSLDMRLTDAPEVSILSHNNARFIAAGPAGRLHVVWRDERDGNYEIYYKMCDGTSWSADQRLTFDPDLSGGAAVAVDSGGAVHVVWHDYRHGSPEIYYKCCVEGSWGPDQRLTETGDDSTNPSLVVGDGGRLHLVWTDGRDGNREIYYKTHDGMSWTPDQRLTDDPASSVYPSVAMGAAGALHVVWTDNRDGHNEIYHKELSGSVWTPDERLTPDVPPDVAEDASLCGDGAGRVHLVWSDYRDDNYEIYYRLHDGITWQPEVRVSDAGGHSGKPTVAVDDSGHVHVVWEDDRDGHYQIYYRKSSEGSWGAEERLTQTPKRAIKPSVTVDGNGDIHVVWTDYRHDNAEIYWKEWFDVILPKPEMFSVDPAGWHSDETVSGARLSGVGFVLPVWVWMERDPEPALFAQNVCVEADTLVTFDIDLEGAEAGPWDVVVKNADGKMDTLPGGFEVMPGRVWSDPKRLTYDPAASYTGQAGCIAADSSGNLHVVWCDLRGGLREVYWKRRCGPSWHGEERLSTSTGGSWAPAVAGGSGGEAHAVWYAYEGGGSEVLYRHYDGSAWQEAVELSGGSGFALYPALAVGAAGAVHVVWSDNCEGGFELYLAECRGGVWSDRRRLTDAGGTAMHPTLAIGPDGRLHLAWQDRRDGRNEIYYKVRDDTAWTADERVTDTWASSEHPSICVGADGTVRLAWSDQRTGYYQIFFAAREDSGWRPDVQVSHASDHALNPSVGVDGTGLTHLVWEDYRDGSEYSEIYSARDHGDGWIEEARITVSPGCAAGPSIAVDGTDTVHMVCCDDCGGNYEIYHRTWSPAAGEPPEIVSLSPQSAAETFPLDAVIDGSGFIGTPRVWLSSQDGDTINANRIHRVASTRLECRFQLVWKSPGTWDLHLRNPDQQGAVLAEALTIYASPWSGLQPVVTDPPHAVTGWNNGRCVLRDSRGGVQVAWHDDREGNFEIYHRRWDGTDWEDETRLTYTEGTSKCPSILEGPGGAIHLCWEDNSSGTKEVYYRKSEGGYWSDPLAVSLHDGRQSKDPSMALDGAGTTVIFFEDNRHGPWQVYSAWFEDSVWVEHRLTEVDAPAYHPAVAADGTGNLHLVWEDERNGGIEVRYAAWDGLAWSESEVLSTETPSVWPCCACDGSGRVMVVWCRGFDELRGALRHGDGWSELGIVDSSGVKPNLAADGGGNFHLVWQSSGAVYHRMYSDGWGGKVRLNPTTDGAQPFVGVDDSGRAAVVWMDLYKGHSEIYMRRWEGAGEVAGTSGPVAGPARFGIIRIVPNPARDKIEVRFSALPVGHLKVKVFDVRGRLVWHADLADPGAEIRSLTWDGRDIAGRAVSPGVYFIRLEAGFRKAQAKVVVLR